MKRKRIYYILASVAALIISIAACKKAVLMNYEGPVSVYFNPSADSFFVRYTTEKNTTDSMSLKYETANVYHDTLFASIGKLPLSAEYVDFRIDVSVLGSPVTHDRKINVIPESTSTIASGDYTILDNSAVIKAGQVRANLVIRCKRTAQLKKTKLYLTLHLLGGENLDTSYYRSAFSYGEIKYKSLTYRTIGLFDNLPAPAYWPYGSTYLGKFSVTKIQYISNALNIPIETLMSSSPTINVVPIWGQMFKCHLKEMTAKGTPVMDMDDATGEVFPMEAGAGASSNCR